MPNFKRFLTLCSVAVAGALAACVVKDNVPPPPPMKPKEEQVKTVEPTKPATETSAKAPETTPPAAGTEDPLVAKGRELYNANACAGCHGDKGQGVLPNAPKFTDAAWQQKEKDEEIVASLKGAKAAQGMPAFKGGAGTDEEHKALVAYVRFLGKSAGK
ncbi:MAG: cytochrome c [Chloracidobacterium sp.]|uniref:Cytochrome c n=1 Tax=Chloracidobacterium validum TaxID=2821543 RepID=A0ABX8B8S3_9BACT|nr:cytochrome c [Chloracidobacterium validum]QUW03342.1 cytochrome c [Chloracidobacterium validum]